MFAEQGLAIQVLLHHSRFESLYWRGISRKIYHGPCRQGLCATDSQEHVVAACPSFAEIAGADCAHFDTCPHREQRTVRTVALY